MRKFILLASVIVFALSGLQAQNVLTSKKGIPILPQKGDVAVGISLTPVLDFIGNLTKINSGSVFSTPALWNYMGKNNTIYVKYFLDDQTAVFAKLRIGYNTSTVTKYSVESQTPDTAHSVDPTKTVEDTWKQSGTNFWLYLGYEKRRGYGRLQGFYGGELSFGISGGSKNVYTYGNVISTDYTTPARTDFGSNNPGPGRWVTESNTAGAFNVGLGGFVGVEYFIFPKISIGGQFGWGLMLNPTGSYGDTETTEEYWGTEPGSTKPDMALRTVVSKSGKKSGFQLENDFSGSAVFLLFHF